MTMGIFLHGLQNMTYYTPKNQQKLGDSESEYPTFVSAFVPCQCAKYTENIHFSTILQYSGLRMNSRGYIHYLWTSGKGVD